MKVSQVMNKNILAVKRSTTLVELIELFRNFHSFPLVPVVDKSDKLIGVVYFQRLIETFNNSAHDIIKMVPFIDEPQADIFDTDITLEVGELVIVDDFMQTKFVSIDMDASVEQAYQLLQVHQRKQLPVVDKDNKLVGIIGTFDIFLALFREKGVIK